MLQIKSVPFDFEGKHYDIRVVLDNGVFRVKAFIGDQPANGYEYTVEEITNFDFHHTHGLSAFDHLIDVARTDVKTKLWEKYVDTMKALQK